MIRVLVVEDSVMVRRLLRRALAAATDIEIVAEASDPYVALELVAQRKPDVLLLDVEIPRIDGTTFLRKLARHSAPPVVVCSSLGDAGAKLALDALDAAALDVIRTPHDPGALDELGIDLLRALRGAAAARRTAGAFVRRPVELTGTTSVEVVALGGATGGTAAIEAIVTRLPPRMPAFVVAQHLPAFISGAFAARLDRRSRVKVEEATEGRVLQDGVVLIAPGDRHLEIVRAGRELRCRLSEQPRVNGQRPSVDVLFDSVARACGASAVAALLSGMGRDGAQGLLELRACGAHTLAQDERTSSVFGMPRAAIELGAACEIVALDEMAPRLARALEARPRAAGRGGLPSATTN